MCRFDFSVKMGISVFATMLYTMMKTRFDDARCRLHEQYARWPVHHSRTYQHAFAAFQWPPLAQQPIARA